MKLSTQSGVWTIELYSGRKVYAFSLAEAFNIVSAYQRPKAIIKALRDKNK